jgi:acetyl esterase/lipase
LVIATLISIFPASLNHRPAAMSITTTPLVIPTGTDRHCRATLHRSGTTAAPLVLHLHAGAFTSAPAAALTWVARLLVQAGATVVSLDYPLAPAHPFPEGIDAAYAALAWLHRQRRRYADAHSPLFIAGEEAGGNLAAAVSLMARDRGEPALAGQILFSPMLDACVATPSLRRAHAGPVGCRYADGWRQYLGRASDAQHPYATPGDAVRLTGLPPTLLVTSADDPFRDETAAYARRVRGAGLPVEQVTLPPGGGFPGVYMAPPLAGDAPWTPAVLAPLQRFLTRASTPSEEHAS